MPNGIVSSCKIRDFKLSCDIFLHEQNELSFVVKKYWKSQKKNANLSLNTKQLEILK